MAASRLCSVDICSKPVHAGGYCASHFYRWRRYGDPLAGRPTPAARGEPMAWLVARVSFDSDECLIWPFATFPNGYGQVVVDRVSQGAHRIMCGLAHGTPPKPRMVAAHFCRNGRRGCVNPKHIRWATSSQNTMDRFAHGTMPVGEKHPGSSISDAAYIQIMNLKGVATQREVAALLGISKSSVGNFWRGDVYRSPSSSEAT